jgi:hypothetical protein
LPQSEKNGGRELKRIWKMMIVSLVILVMFGARTVYPELPSTTEEQVNLLFSDDFESYETGTKPSTWQIIVGSETGREYLTDTRIIDDFYYSPIKSLYIKGVTTITGTKYAVTAARTFSSSARFLAHEFQFATDMLGTTYISFWAGGLGRVTSVYCDKKEIVVYNYTGNFLDRIVIEEINMNQWYKILVVLDRQEAKWSVWINDILKIKNLQMSYAGQNPNINSVWMTAGLGNCYFWTDDVKVYEGLQQPPYKTDMELRIIDNQKWYTNINVPLNIDELGDYIDNFESNGKPALDFGNIPMNIEVQNIGDEAAENVICNCFIDGIAVMIHLSGVNIYEDKKVIHILDTYQVSEVIEKVEKGETKNITINIPLKYMCIVAGKMVLDKESENFGEVYIDIVFTIMQLNIIVQVNSSNSQTVEESTKLYAVGNSNQLLDIMLDAMRKRLEHHKEEALKKLLEMHIGVLATGVGTTAYSVEVGQHRFDTTLDPGTSSLNVGVIIPTGLKLVGLIVTLKEVTSGVTWALSVSSPIVSGIAIVCFSDIYKLLPRGIITAQIDLEIASETVALNYQVEQQNNDTILTISKLMTVEYFEITWKNEVHYIAVSTNATIGPVLFLEEPSPRIEFNSTGIVNATHFYKVIIPSKIMNNFEIWFNDYKVPEFDIKKNTTHTFLYFTHYFYEEHIKIIIIPELSSLIIIALLIIASMTVVVLSKKRFKRIL